MKSVQRKDLIYPELSYKIIGCAFEVHNSLGGGHHEKYYQRALAQEFGNQGLHIQQQLYFPLSYRGKVVGKNFFDFLVEERIVVEIKKGERYSRRHVTQVNEYLKTSGLPLAILINFGTSTVSFKRIVNVV